MEKYKPEQLLANAIGFTEHDLDANRSGELSMAQRHKLHDEGIRMLRLSLLCFGILLLMMAVIVFRLRPDTTLYASIGLVAAWVLFYCGWRWLGLSADARDVPKALEDRVKLETYATGRSGLLFRLEIEGVKFGIKKDVFLAFKNGDPYRIYYGPRSKTLLSVEWLR